jgi:hypothetical protein
VDVVVSVEGASSPTSAADLFTYSGPFISGVDPNHGPRTGGTPVEIAGGGFPPYLGTGNNLAVAFGDAQTSAMCLGSDVLATTSCSTVTPPVNTAGPVQVVATAYGASSPTSPASVFTYDRYPSLTKFQLPDAFFGIESAIYLNGNAPSEGVAVAINSSDPSVVRPQQPIVTVPAGSKSAAAPLEILPRAQAKQVTLTASYQGSWVSATMDLAASPPLAIDAPTNLLQDQSGAVTISLNGPAPVGGAAVVLSSDDPASIAMPPSNSATIAAGTYATSFSITDHYAGLPKYVKISAAYGASASWSIRVPSSGSCPVRKCPNGKWWNPDDCACTPGVPQ